MSAHSAKSDPPPLGAEPIRLRERGTATFGAGPVTGSALGLDFDVFDSGPVSGFEGFDPAAGSSGVGRGRWAYSPVLETRTSAPRDAAAARRRTMRWFAGGAALVFGIGIAVILALTLTGNSAIIKPQQAAAPNVLPPLAKACPPPSAGPAPEGNVPATPSGPRTVDNSSGISYKAYGQPWLTWDRAWQTGGELGVVFRTGQYFVTENMPDGNQYLATILSGSVPAATNDAMTLDLKCAGDQVTADVRQAYYPQPNTMDTIKEQQTMLGGRPAWVSEFRLHFHEDGLRATSELAVIAVIDIGKPDAAILYVSIPDTHKQYDYVIDELLPSVRPT